MQKRGVDKCTIDSPDKANLTKFRKMIKESGNNLLNLMEINDDVMLRFIRRPQVNLHESLKILTNIVELRFSHPYIEIAEKGYPSAVRHVFNKQIIGVLQQRDKLGRKVIWWKLSRWNPDQVSEHDMVRAIVILAWELLSSKVTQLKGIVGIVDASGCSSIQLKLLTPSRMQVYLQLFLIHIHNKKERLLEYIPANTLPNFLGGMLTEKDATDSIIIEYILQKDKYYKRLLQMGKDEFFRLHPDLRALNIIKRF